MTQRMLPPISVAVAPAGEGDIATYYHATATLEPDKEARILARVSGLVTELLAEEGDRVEAGDELLRIEEAEYRFRLQQAEAEAAKQKARFQRLEKMLSNELIAAEEYESARSDMLSTESARELAALELARTHVRAPFGGRVTERRVDPGQMVSAGQELFTLADLSRLLARVHVPAKAFRNLQVNQPVELVLDSNKQQMQGRIELISPVIDAGSGTIKVTAAISDYPPDTRPGDFAEVRIVTDRHSGVVLVPKAAVFTDRGERIAYVARPDSLAERRVVTVGFQNDDSIEIVSGIERGEQVVVQGQRSLEQGQPLIIHTRPADEAPPGASGAAAGSHR
jgi:membrane fusion protein, multidrug efflux system